MSRGNEDSSVQEGTVTLDECKRRIESACAESIRQRRRELREEIVYELLEEKELPAALKVHLKNLVKSPDMGLGTRDIAENLRNELESVIKDMEQNKTNGTSQPGAAVSPEIAEKIQTARATIEELDVRIKHFDRLEKEISVKIETLVTRQRIKTLAVFLGGFMIFMGAMTLTGALLLALSPSDFPFVYSAFDEFFNYLLMLLGGTLIISGFLHQT
jgi:hypothetical protein